MLWIAGSVEAQVGVREIDYFGYDGCIALENATTRVVLGPHVGGRVLEYALDGTNAIYLDPAQAGWVWDPDGPVTRFETPNPTGGRIDVGPEHVLPKRPALWLGPWQGEITGDRSARMTSVEDPSTGLRLVRDFELNAESSRLTVTQTMTNVSDDTTTTCHWSRTFGVGHGICVVPRSGPVRFPRGYIVYGPGRVMNFQPDDPAVRVTDDFVTLLDTPQQAKLGLDSYAGWFAYLMPNDLMWVKRYPTYPERGYAEMAGLTISLWYKDDLVCELEPIGPMEILAPGESASFTETWYLLKEDFPENRADVDERQVAERVGKDAR